MARSLPPLDHVLTLSDDVGIIQHARESIPDRSTGYCTDDVSRALIVMLMRLGHEARDAETLRLASTYLAFLQHAQLPDGSFHNFMSYERAWLDEVGTKDSVGRAMWSLGFAVRNAPRASWRRVCAQMLDRSLNCIAWLEHPRAQAYAMLGLAHACDTEPTPERTAALRELAQSLASLYERERSDAWEWFEPMMTYDNARLAEAMLRAGSVLDDIRLLEIGRVTLAFLERTVFEDGVFVPIGNDGWFRRGGPRARFAQQPLEAASMVDAELAAFDAFGDPAHRAAAALAAAWYDGKNLLAVGMAHGGGCYDGLEADGPNRNMGAESTLAYLAAVHAQE
ncbi:MAG: hypothetical protein WCC70_14595 [Candidatus Aquilonibacter sp.]